MSTSDKKTMSKGLTRRDALKLSGLALGGLAFAGSAGKSIAATSKYGGGNPNAPLDSFYPTHDDTQRYTYFEQLKPITQCADQPARCRIVCMTKPMQAPADGGRVQYRTRYRARECRQSSNWVNLNRCV